MNDNDNASRPQRRGPRDVAATRRFLETPWAGLAAGALIMLGIALAAFVGDATPM
jgi:hypothetical protein